MKIGINLLPLRPGKNGGMEVYLRNLLEHLFRIDTINQYYLITAPYNDTSLNFSVPNCTKIQIHEKKERFQNTIFPLTTLFGKSEKSPQNIRDIIDFYQLDIWFCPFLSLDPRPLKIPGIVTIPDIQHEFYPDFFSHEELTARKGYILPSCEEATKIITISEFSKNSFNQKMGIDPEKIEVIYLATSDDFNQPSGDIKNIKIKYNLPDNYFLYPANAWPHKNHQNLIIAFNLYRKTYDDSVHLVLTGSNLKNNPVIDDLVSLVRLNDSIHILGYVDSKDMPGLYMGAKALIFPSLFEGFGIPLLEAMATGCPIIASNSTSIPEVGGDAAYYFDPKKPQNICDAMHRIIHDNQLRETLIKKGKDRISHFSYDKVARMHLHLFNSAYTKADDARIAYYNHEKTLFEGIYSDGWISRMMFKYNGPKIIRYVQIDLVGGLPITYPQKITVILNKKEKTKILIPSLGKHSYTFEYSQSERRQSEYFLEIIPERTYIPKKLAINDDEREISVLLDKLVLIDEKGAATNYFNRDN